MSCIQIGLDRRFSGGSNVGFRGWVTSGMQSCCQVMALEVDLMVRLDCGWRLKRRRLLLSV